MDTRDIKETGINGFRVYLTMVGVFTTLLRMLSMVWELLPLIHSISCKDKGKINGKVRDKANGKDKEGNGKDREVDADKVRVVDADVKMVEGIAVKATDDSETTLVPTMITTASEVESLLIKEIMEDDQMDSGIRIQILCQMVMFHLLGLVSDEKRDRWSLE